MVSNLRRAACTFAICLFSLPFLSAVGRARAWHDNRPAASLRAFTLKSPFTLKYTLKYRMLPSPVEVAHPPQDPGQETHRITLSANGPGLLCRDEWVVGGVSVSDTDIFDGKVMYEVEALGDKPPLTRVVSQGFDLRAMGRHFPLPGAGLPYLPLLNVALSRAQQSTNASWFSADDGYVPKKYLTEGITHETGLIDYAFDAAGAPIAETAGRAGFVMDDEKTKVLWYYWLNKLAPSVIYDYSEHRLFKGIWLPDRISERTFMPSHSEATLYETSDFLLDSASTAPLAQAFFEVSSYVPGTAAVADLTGKNAKTFIYMPGHGTLAEQEARQDVIRAAVLAKGNKPDPKPGLFLLASLVLSFATLAYWRYQETRRANVGK